MTLTVLYPERMYPDSSVEEKIFGPGVRVVMRDVQSVAELDQADCDAADGLMIFRFFVTPEELARFPKLKAVVRMGVGYDRLPRRQAEKQGVMVCNVPDYGTAEVSDHAMALMLSLRRGITLHHDAQRASAPWRYIDHPAIQRLSRQRLGIIGIGRMGTAVALKAKAFGMKIAFYDPFVPNGTELALGIERCATLDELLRRSDILSIHTPLSPETTGMIGARELALLPENAILVNTARGPIVDIDAVEAALKSGRLAAAGLDVIPVEPPVDPIPSLLRAYRANEDWLAGRLIITPHSAFHTPDAWTDIRVKSAETIKAALLGPRPQNVIGPDDF